MQCSGTISNFKIITYVNKLLVRRFNLIIFTGINIPAKIHFLLHELQQLEIH